MMQSPFIEAHSEKLGATPRTVTQWLNSTAKRSKSYATQPTSGGPAMPEDDRTPLEPDLEVYVAEGLKKNLLSRSEKKWQLYGKGVKGHDAEAVLDALYGASSNA